MFIIIIIIITHIWHWLQDKNNKQSKRSAWKLLVKSFCTLLQSFSDLAWEVLAGLGERLWSEERWRSHCTGQQGVSSLELVADPKVSYFNVFILTNQQVRRLNVAVNDFLIVYCREDEKTSSFLLTAQTTDRKLHVRVVFGLTVLNSSKHVLEVEASLLLIQGFISWDLHYCPVDTPINITTHVHQTWDIIYELLWKKRN